MPNANRIGAVVEQMTDPDAMQLLCARAVLLEQQCANQPRQRLEMLTLGRQIEAGRNVRQVADWLGHADPSFTLRTYVHLMDKGIGDAEFMDQAVGGSPLPGLTLGAPWPAPPT